MKKVLVSLVLILLVCLTSCSGVKGENITGITATENMVYFEPKCPECNHISGTKMLNLCKGEDYSSIYQCEECFEVYDISVVR